MEGDDERTSKDQRMPGRENGMEPVMPMHTPGSDPVQATVPQAERISLLLGKLQREQKTVSEMPDRSRLCRRVGTLDP